LLSLNVTAMTIFLYFSNEQPATNDNDNAQRGYEKLKHASYMDETLEENAEIEHINITITFCKPVPCRPRLKRLLHSNTEPQANTFRLLARLKSRYYLRIAMLNNLNSKKIGYKDQNPFILKLVDYYITPGTAIKNRLKALGINHIDFKQTKVELAAIGLRDY